LTDIAKVNNEEAKDILSELVKQQLTEYSFGIPAAITKNVTYIVTQKDMYDVRLTPFGHIVTKIKELPELKDEVIKEGVHFQAGKIPFQFLKRFLAGGRLIDETYHTEFLYYIFYDPVNKDWVEYVPKQSTSGGNTKEIDVKERPNLYMAMHLHTHPGFSCGGFSGGDDRNDTVSGSAMLFGLAEKIQSEEPLLHFRARCGHGFVKLNIFDVFTNPLLDDDMIGPADIPKEEWLKKIIPAAAIYDMGDVEFINNSMYCNHQNNKIIPLAKPGTGQQFVKGIRLHVSILSRTLCNKRTKLSTKEQYVRAYLKRANLNPDTIKIIRASLMKEIPPGEWDDWDCWFPSKQGELFPMAVSEEEYLAAVQETALRNQETYWREGGEHDYRENWHI
jgi:hypothetical protein